MNLLLYLSLSLRILFLFSNALAVTTVCQKVITKQTIPINQASVKSNIKPITIEESTYHACY